MGRSVTWLGHATVLIEVGGLRLLTDPLLRGRFLHVRRRVEPIDMRRDVGAIDAVLISHLHPDHFDVPSLRMLGEDVPVVVPEGAGRFAQRAGMRHVDELRVGRQLDLGSVTVEAFPAAHSGFRPPFGPRAVANGYVIGADAATYFAGDTGLFDGMADLRGAVDLALLPVGGWGPTLRGGHLDPVEAAAAASMIGPRRALPIHWGTYWPIGLPLLPRFTEPGSRFIQALGALPEAVEARLWHPGTREPLGE